MQKNKQTKQKTQEKQFLLTISFLFIVIYFIAIFKINPQKEEQALIISYSFQIKQSLSFPQLNCALSHYWDFCIPGI